MMRRILFSLLNFLFVCCGQNRMTDNLEVLCKVWGFVKYHHPVFADSTADADRELFRLLPQIEQADKKERNRLLTEWIASLGSFEENRARYDSIERNPDCRLSADPAWIMDSDRLGAELQAKLLSLRYADREDDLPIRYRGPWRNESNEKKYERESPQYRYRLLALFRYWNLIEYFFPYRELTDQDWHDVLREYIPKFAEAEDRQAYQLVLCELFTETCDSHAFSDRIMLFGNRIVPVQMQMVGKRLIVASSDKYAALGDSGLLPGDEILAVDGSDVEKVSSRIRQYVSSSTEAHHRASVALHAMQSGKSEITVRYRRDGTVRDTSCATVPFFELAALMYDKKRYYRNLDDSIAYLHMGGYRHNPSLYDSLERTKGVVIDLRTYPLHHEEWRLFEEYLLRGRTHMATLEYSIKSLPGYFCSKKIYRGHDDGGRRYEGKIVVLVNGDTQSAAEFDAMALQTIPETRVIGSGTSGADGDLLRLYLPCGIESGVSGVGVYYPDGSQTQRIGVRIDEIVEPTIEGIKAGRDELLERAIEIINEQ